MLECSDGTHRNAHLSAGPELYQLPDLVSACMLTSSAAPAARHPHSDRRFRGHEQLLQGWLPCKEPEDMQSGLAVAHDIIGCLQG